MVKIKISKTLEAKIKKGYPWVFKYQLQNPVSKNSGSLAVLYENKNRFLAIGIWDSTSDLCFRVLSLFEPKEIYYGFFLERFKKALLLRKGLIEQGTTGYRVLNGENDGFPGLVLDKYDNLNAAIITPDFEIVENPDKLSPAFIIFNNYRLILKWNRSLRFALAICTLKEKFSNAL